MQRNKRRASDFVHDYRWRTLDYLTKHGVTQDGKYFVTFENRVNVF